MMSYAFSASDIDRYFTLMSFWMSLYKKFIIDFRFKIQKYSPPPAPHFSMNKANILENMQVSSLSYSATYSEQKVAIATPEINENCHYVRNDPHNNKF